MPFFVICWGLAGLSDLLSIFVPKDLLNSNGEAGLFDFTFDASICENFYTGLELLGRLGGPVRIGFGNCSDSWLTFG